MGASTGGSPGATTTNPIKIVANIFISFIGAGVLGLPFAVKEAGVFQALVVMTAVAFLSIKAMLMLIDCKYKILESQGRNRRRQKRTVKKSGVSIELNFPSSEPPSVHVDIGGRSAAESLLPLIESSFSEDEGYAEESAGSGSSPVPSATSLTQTVNYGDIGHVAFGPVGRTVVDLTLTVSQFGFCCAYLIFITENLTHSELLTKIQCLTFLLPLLFGLTLLKDLSRLAVFSLLAQISSLFAFAVVFWFDFQHYHYGATHVEMVAFKGFPFYFAVAIYCYEGQGLVLSLEESLSPSIRHKFRTYFVSTLAAVTILYLSFGVSGYLSFGPATNAIITNNLPHSRGLDFAVLVKTCLCFSLFFTYPIMMFPVLQLLEKRQPILKQNHFGVILRFSVVALTGFVVVAIPNFAHLMALIGATCCTLLAFILPALFHLKVFKRTLSKSMRRFNYFLICIGVLGAVLGTHDTLVRMGEEREIKVKKTTVVATLRPQQERATEMEKVSTETGSKYITSSFLPPVKATSNPPEKPNLKGREKFTSPPSDLSHGQIISKSTHATLESLKQVSKIMVTKPNTIENADVASNNNKTMKQSEVSKSITVIPQYTLSNAPMKAALEEQSKIFPIAVG